MRCVVQRVRDCSVTVDGECISKIGKGILVYLGINRTDTEQDALYLAEKVLHLRLFPDPEGKMNLSVLGIDGEILVVSQFTLYGDTRRGRRPSYDEAAPPSQAEPLFSFFLQELTRQGVIPKTGKFQAKMDVCYVNEGPVTLLIDSKKTF